MSDKLGPGVWHETGPDPPARRDGGSNGDPPAPRQGLSSGGRDDAEIDRLKTKRDNARWTAVAGFGALFMAGFSTTFALGGAAMVAYGVAAGTYWGHRLKKAKGDPWAYDPELDGPNGLP